MIVKPELVKKIKDYFGLNIYETKVWLALIGKGMASAGEVADISGVPRSRTYDVLESLEKRGFAIAKIGKPVKYLAVKPEIVIEKLKQNTIRNTDDRIKSLSKIRETEEYGELEKLYHSGLTPIKREDISTSLKGKPNIMNQLREVLLNSKKEVIICTDVDDVTSKMRIYKQIFERLKSSKVSIKMALKGDPKAVQKLSALFEVPIKSLHLEGKFFISDKKEVLFYISKNSDEEESAVWLNSAFFAESMADLFEKAFKGK